MTAAFRLRVALADLLVARVLVPMLGVVGCVLDLWRGDVATVLDLWPDEETPPVVGESVEAAWPSVPCAGCASPRKLGAWCPRCEAEHPASRAAAAVAARAEAHPDGLPGVLREDELRRAEMATWGKEGGS